MRGLQLEINPIRICIYSIALGIAIGSLSFAQNQKDSRTTYPSKKMADGKQWMTQNLNIKTNHSYCYGDAEKNCLQYGRLYTWASAQQVCQSLGNGWRFPTDDDWRQLAKHYGGVSADSEDKGKTAYKALLSPGSSGFNAVLGGGRSPNGQYARLEAHGFYWTSTDIDPATGWTYNFGKGGQALHRQDGGEKESAFSVRCIR